VVTLDRRRQQLRSLVSARTAGRRVLAAAPVRARSTLCVALHLAFVFEHLVGDGGVEPTAERLVAAVFEGRQASTARRLSAGSMRTKARLGRVIRLIRWR
jgi:hypothetical protein